MQVLDGEGAAVVIHLRVAIRAVVGPAAAAVEGVQVVHVGEDAVLREGSSVCFQAQVGEDAEPQPVGVWHLFVVHRSDPGCYVALFLVAQRIPEVFACYGEGEADRARFDHSLVQVFHVAPELRSVGVSATDQCFDEEMRLVILGVASEERRQTPKRSGIAFYLCCSLVDWNENVRSVQIVQTSPVSSLSS